MKKPYDSPEFHLLCFSFEEVLSVMDPSDPQGHAEGGSPGVPGDPFGG